MNILKNSNKLKYRIKKNIRISQFLILIITFFACSSAKGPFERGTLTTSPIKDSTHIKLDGYLNKQATKGFKGEVYVVRNGKVILNNSYGQKETNKKTAYWIASNAKAVVSLAIQKLEDDKLLSTFDPIIKYFSEIPPDKKHITIHQLLTHSSGLPHKYATDNIKDYEKAFQAVMSIPVKKEDIGKYEYSNDGYAILVFLIEKLTGMTYEEYIEQKIFKPAGLNHTGFWGYEKENVTIAPLFDPARAAQQPETMYKDGRSVANYGQKGPSGVYSTAEDQYTIFKATMDGKIIPKNSVQKAFQPYVFLFENEDLVTYYAYGWFVGYKDGQLINVRHTGEETWLGHNSMRIFYPNGDAIVVLSNAHLAPEEDLWAVQVAYDLEYLIQRLE